MNCCENKAMYPQLVNQLTQIAQEKWELIALIQRTGSDKKQESKKQHCKVMWFGTNVLTSTADNTPLGLKLYGTNVITTSS